MSDIALQNGRTGPVALSLGAALEAGVAEAGAVLCDLDGCLIAGDRLLPDAARLWALCGARLAIVSNNSTETAERLAARLAGLGLPVPAERIFLAGEETLRQLSQAHPGAAIALFATPQMQRRAQAFGLKPGVEPAEVAVLLRDTGFDFSALARLAALVHRGVPLWLSNPDAAHPAADGTPQPETGALLAALQAMVPALCVAHCPGKPAPDLLLLALRQLGVRGEDSVFLGDSPVCDGGAAQALGLRFVLLNQCRPAEAQPC